MDRRLFAMFETARQSKTTEIIIGQIRTAILAGRLAPGDRLPPEKKLGEQFQVSKQTLRESMRALEHMGLIDVRKGVGGGAFIVAVDEQVAAQNLANYLYFKDLTIENLSEFRRIMEPYAAARAAERISASDLETLRRLNASTRENLRCKHWDRVSRDEIAFHRLIARQTGNPILILMLDFVETLLEDFKKILKPDAGFMGSVMAAHEAIAEAIADGDADLAAEQMRAHVIDVEGYLARLKKSRAGKKLWENCLKGERG
ncbi:GntR family transcriptional regulator [Desulfosarcina alkanivorans]|uniref:GntR family transcriptional regulator n=1 Tax=Desulfosarcina alkanivorans TaxID=571177 RepID=A0A5K7YDN4_9BACT|nr:FCD domain-containing protein [Desulfosarcina alkanivorans]BBO67602.1 GntR family transcriptional regulator [Desulfosarcina alkanivorans]